jgi:D-methionine transport system ATP-binding protein
VGIARALATNPSLLLADESTSALDPETTQEVLALLRRVNRELGITIVVITHEMDVVRSLAHRVVVMEAGRIVEEGPVLEVLSDPQQPVTRRFVATIVDDEPDAEALAALHARHSGTFVKLAFRGDEVRQSDVFAELLRHGVTFELVYGGIEEVQGETFGNLTLALDGEAAAVEQAVLAVRDLVPTTELSR